jgi:hypothetical protein
LATEYEPGTPGCPGKHKMLVANPSSASAEPTKLRLRPKGGIKPITGGTTMICNPEAARLVVSK